MRFFHVFRPNQFAGSGSCLRSKIIRPYSERIAVAKIWPMDISCTLPTEFYTRALPAIFPAGQSFRNAPACDKMPFLPKWFYVYCPFLQRCRPFVTFLQGLIIAALAGCVCPGSTLFLQCTNVSCGYRIPLFFGGGYTFSSSSGLNWLIISSQRAFSSTLLGSLVS